MIPQRRLAAGLGVRFTVPNTSPFRTERNHLITRKEMMFTNYETHPVEIISETVWIVHDPWEGSDVGTFQTKEAAELFAQEWMIKNG